MKIKAIFLFVMMLFSISALAQGSRVVDNAGLLNSEQKTYLEERIASIAETYKFDLVIVTEKNEGASDPEGYANRFFDNNGYGFGTGRGGCLFLQITDSRDYQFSASGRGEKVLNNTAFTKLDNNVLKFLRENMYFEAYCAFISAWEEFLTLEANGRSYNFFYRWNLVLVISSWILALVIGVTAVLIWKSQMNTVLPQTQADAYAVPGSLAFKTKNDRFMYSTVTKVKRETQSSSVSSSRRSSRGGGGKY